MAEPTLRSLFGLSRAFQESKLLCTACALDLFSPLASGPADPAEVAAAAGVSERGADLMLRALVAMGLLHHRAGRFALTPVARRHLLPSSPAYAGHIFRHMDDVYGRWAHLADAVRTGTSAAPRARDKSRRDWALAMADNVGEDQRAAIGRIDLAGCRTLIDLGGGPGAYSLLFAQANPRLRVTLFDRPGIVEVAGEFLAGKPGAKRVTTVAGDLFEDPPRGSWDAAWLSHVIHSQPPERARELIALAAGLLNPGGRLIVHDFVLSANRISPRRAAIFAVHMLAVTEGGRSYSGREITEFMREAGLTRARRTAFAGETSLVIGEKAAAQP